MDDKPKKYSLSISLAAKEDLLSIYVYGRDIWGKRRTEKYLDNIKIQFIRLLTNPFIGRKHSSLKDIHGITVESHKLFYRVKGTQVEIIRVIHRRQDVERNLP